MSDAIRFRYQTLNGSKRKVEYEPIPGSSHWSRTTYEMSGDEWEVAGSAEVKYVREVDADE